MKKKNKTNLLRVVIIMLPNNLAKKSPLVFILLIIRNVSTSSSYSFRQATFREKDFSFSRILTSDCYKDIENVIGSRNLNVLYGM